jgi:hypothetical protein
MAFGIDDRGRTVGGYVDGQGRLHGFLKDKIAFSVIDFPSARATLIARMNAQRQIVGAYSEEANAVATDLPHGFLLDNGVFTKIDVPGAARTQLFSINNRGQVVGFYDNGGRGFGFMWENGTFTEPDIAPGAFGTSFPLDVDDRGRIFGVFF